MFEMKKKKGERGAYAPWWFAAQEKHGTGIPYSSTQTPPPPVARLQAVEDELK